MLKVRELRVFVPSLSHILPHEKLDDCRTNAKMPRDILVRLSRLPTKQMQIEAYREYKAGSLSRDDLKLRLRHKPRRSYSFIKSFSKRFVKFDIDNMEKKDRQIFRKELENLQAKINQALETLGE